MEVEVCVGDVVYREDVFGHFEINVMDLAFAKLDVVMTLAGDAVLAEFDFVGKHKRSVNDIVDFLAAAVLVDGMANDADIGVAKRATVAIIGLQETACDACAVAGVIVFSAYHATIVKHAGDFCENHVVITPACAASEILSDSSDIEPVFNAMVAAELYVFIGRVGAYSFCPNAPFCIVVYAVMKLFKKNHINSSILIYLLKVRSSFWRFVLGVVEK